MSLEDWKNKEISQLLSEAWGFKFNTLQEFDEFNGEGEIQEEATEEGEIEEGGTAKRGENAEKGTERGMNLADRIHEEEEEEAEELEEQCPPAEEDEVVVALDEAEEEADLEEETTSRMSGLRKTRGEVEPEEEEETEDLKEAIKTLLTKYLKG